jgi:Tfp pilus assembly protein PilX
MDATERGAALIVVMVFIVMLLMLLMAFFSKSTLQQQVSKSSSTGVLVDVFAQGAVDTIVGDLKQEIADGSVVTNVVTTSGTTTVTNTIYYPATNANAVPRLVGCATNTNFPNLVKISTNLPFYSLTNSNGSLVTGINRATTNSTTNASANGRSISADRWNKPLLLPRSGTAVSGVIPKYVGSTNTTPDTNFVSPSWILVNRVGSNPTTTNGISWSATNPTTVIGRYAYTIYNEGGVLDLSVAGYPVPAVAGTASNYITTNAAYKTALTYADLTLFSNNSPPAQMSNSYLLQILAWRNAGSLGTNTNFPAANITNFVQMIAGATNGFMAVQTNTTGGNTERAFVSRQQLINFFNTKLSATNQNNWFAVNALQFFSTFSRALEQPSYAPATNRPFIITDAAGGGNSAFSGSVGTADQAINPSFLSIRVTNSFTRNDGTQAMVGEPLVKKRFALNRLTWLTYKGPSASRGSVTSPSYGANGADNDLYALENTHGIPVSWLQQGNAANISKYFGLSWTNSSYWVYDSAKLNSSGLICTLSQVASQNREPNFIELLKAAILAGSVGKDFPTDISDTMQNSRYTTLDCSIMQIAANIIAQSTCDGYPPHLQLTLGSITYDFYGVKNLPYLYRVRNAALTTALPTVSGTGVLGSSTVTITQSNMAANFQFTSFTGTLSGAGTVTVVQIPEIWNPHSFNPNDTIYNYGQGSPCPTNFNLVCSNSGVLSFDAIAWGKDTNIGSSLSSPTSTLTFTIPTNGPYLFREPTLLMISNVPTGSALGGTGISAFGTPSAYTTNPPNGVTSYTNAIPGTTKTPFVGFILGTAPVAWTNGSSLYLSVFTKITPSAGSQLTYQMGYMDASGTYQPYDTKVSGHFGSPGVLEEHVSGGWSTFADVGYTSLRHLNSLGAVGGYQDQMIPYINSATVFDPRTGRFGFQTMNYGGDFQVSSPPPRRHTWIGPEVRWNASTQNILESERPNNHVGLRIINSQSSPGNSYPPQNDKGWYWGNGTVLKAAADGSFTLAHGLFVQNRMGVYNDGITFAASYGETGPPDFGQLGCSYTTSSQYFADPDGVVRRAMGGHMPLATAVTSTNTVGQPMATSVFYTATASSISPNYCYLPVTNIPVGASAFWYGNPYRSPMSPLYGDTNGTLYSRPVVLNRPFKTVGELAYTFSDTPWRNIDFSSPESGSSGLLDVFCIQDSPPDALVAGKIDLNTRQQPVLTAVLSTAYPDTYFQYGNPLYPTIASVISSKLISRTTNNVSGYGPLKNLTDLVGSQIASSSTMTLANQGINGANTNYWDGFSGSDLDSLYLPSATNIMSTLSVNTDVYFNNIKRIRETPIRALASCGQTRVWNLMIDVVAQTGKYPSSATGIDKFMVEGEQRYWVHLAIDRMTGQILEKQIEVVKE